MIPLTEDSMYLLLISNEATDDRIDDPAERLARLRALVGALRRTGGGGGAGDRGRRGHRLHAG